MWVWLVIFCWVCSNYLFIWILYYSLDCPNKVNVTITTKSFEGYIYWGIGSFNRYQHYSSWQTHTTTCCLSPGSYMLTFNIGVAARGSSGNIPQSNGGFFTIQGQRYFENLNEDNYYYDTVNVTILGMLYSILATSSFTITGEINSKRRYCKNNSDLIFSTISCWLLRKKYSSGPWHCN